MTSQSTSPRQTILITGGAGNLGGKLSTHLADQHELRLLDIKAGAPEVIQADFAEWNEAWTQHFRGVDTVVHLAADPNAGASWEAITPPNIDGLINVFTAAAQAGVKRIIYASSNHAMGGYQHLAEPAKVTTDIPAKPGAFYSFDGETEHNSLAYGSAKYFGERLGKTYHDIYGISVLCVRIGWIRAGANKPEEHPKRSPWFWQMWLSNRDYCNLMQCCINADPQIGFAVVNGMSNNVGMRWDLAYTEKLIGYVPQDGLVEMEQS